MSNLLTQYFTGTEEMIKTLLYTQSYSGCLTFTEWLDGVHKSMVIFKTSDTRQDYFLLPNWRRQSTTIFISSGVVWQQPPMMLAPNSIHFGKAGPKPDMRESPKNLERKKFFKYIPFMTAIYTVFIKKTALSVVGYV